MGLKIYEFISYLPKVNQSGKTIIKISIILQIKFLFSPLSLFRNKKKKNKKDKMNQLKSMQHMTRTSHYVVKEKDMQNLQSKVLPSHQLMII